MRFKFNSEGVKYHFGCHAEGMQTCGFIFAAIGTIIGAIGLVVSTWAMTGENWADAIDGLQELPCYKAGNCSAELYQLEDKWAEYNHHSLIYIIVGFVVALPAMLTAVCSFGSMMLGKYLASDKKIDAQKHEEGNGKDTGEYEMIDQATL